MRERKGKRETKMDIKVKEEKLKKNKTKEKK